MNIEPDENKVKVIKNYPEPKCLKELQSFIGILNYLHKFIPNLAELTAPLRE